MDTRGKLDYFYRELFPAEQLYAWSQHGNSDPKLAAQREYSITISSNENVDGVFVRYNACPTVQIFRQMFLRNNDSWVSKLDIGPFFNADVSRHKERSLTPESKELVFDIDMDDYNAVRTCCEDKKVCSKCFAYLSAAAKILHHILTDTFGFKHVLFVFSGRRGIHVWISDYNARMLSGRQREGLASYLYSGLNDNKKLANALLDHPILQTAFEILESDFIQLFKTQDFFDSTTKINALIDRYFDNPDVIKKGYAANVGHLPVKTNQDKYFAALRAHAFANQQSSGIKRLVLDYLYPRLDIEVSKQLNHLLKSPFCIHPATGKVCVPIPYNELSTFNPDNAPKLDDIIQQHKEAQSNGRKVAWADGAANKKYLSTTPPKDGVLSTSLQPYVEFFTKFVIGMIADEHARIEEERNLAATMAATMGNVI